MLKSWGVPIIIHQPKYNMFDRWPEDGLFDVLLEEGIGSIPFSPLAQGLLTPKYLHGIPENSRIADPDGFLQKEELTDSVLQKIKDLNAIAEKRGQSLAQLALVWVLRHPAVTTALIGISSIKQLENNITALDNLEITDEELNQIDSILKN